MDWNAFLVSFEPEPLEAGKGRAKNVWLCSPARGRPSLEGLIVQRGLWGLWREEHAPRLSDRVEV